MKKAILLLGLLGSGCLDWEGLSKDYRADGEYETDGAAQRDSGTPDATQGVSDMISVVDAITTDAIELPARCLDIRSLDPHASDGNYTLFYQKDPTKPWTAYCLMSGGNAKEYISLGTGPDTNYSQYTAGGYAAGTNVRTSYQKIRIDPISLLVDVSDQTFATSSGMSHVAGQDTVTSMPYGVAMDCMGNDKANGSANLDLSGTPFTFDPQWFKPGATGIDGQGNFVAFGGATFANKNTVVNLKGGGSCGWWAGAWAAGKAKQNPYNKNGGFVMPLRFL